MSSLTLNRRLKAPAAMVYAAWTEPNKMMRWFCPRDSEVLYAEAQPRVEGKFRVIMRTPDGIKHTARGIYQEVVPNEKLVFTWSWEAEPEWDSLVTVELKAGEGYTDLTLLHERLPSETSRNGHQEGWTGALEHLEHMFVMEA